MDQETNISQLPNGAVHLSVVSHEQDDLVDQLLESVAKSCQPDRIIVTVTRNTRIASKFTFKRFPFPVIVLQNLQPKGFGANHNQAFTTCRQEYFCVVNPDIILTSDLFDDLISSLSFENVGVAAPVLVDSDGTLQDSARKYPTPWRILSRIWRGKAKQYEYPQGSGSVFPDWVAGMFMLFPAHIYQEMSGFDERYFMYCEDADICMRLSQRGYKTQLVFQAQAIHNARRASHRTMPHLRWHMSSLFRFFLRYPFYTL